MPNMTNFKIVKLTPRMWAGVGFGHRSAGYGIVGRPNIRIVRESHGWYAYIGTDKLFAESKVELETMIGELNHA